MISYDPEAPHVLRVESARTDEVLSALASGRPVEGSADVEPEMLEILRAILSEPRGRMRLESAGKLHRVTHELTLAAQGSLRRSPVRPGLDEIAVFPTPMLSGVLLRLIQLAPVEPLPSDLRIAVPSDLVDSVLIEDHEARTAPLAALEDAASALPPASDAQLEEAPLRVHRLTRRTDSGDRTAHVLLLRGRYLRLESGALGATLVGSDPTGAHRVLDDLLNPRR